MNQKRDNQLDLANQFCFPIYALAKETVNIYRPLLEAIDLTYPQYLVMLVLWKENTQTVSQLGKKLSLDSGTLTPLLKRLEQKSLITRKRCSADERIVHITLTDEGSELREQAKCIPGKMMESINISPEELATLKSIICKLLNRSK